MKKKLNILVTCCSRKTSIFDYLEYSLKNFKLKSLIVAGDSDKNVIMRYMGYKFWHMPKIMNRNNKKILNYCKRNKIDIIIPTSDFELLFWAKHKDEFAENKIYTMISNYRTIKICQNKWLFYEFLKKNNIYTPKSFLKISDIKNKNKKFIIKENYSHNSSKFYLKKISFEKLKRSIHLFKNPIIQEYVAGKEISIDCYVNPDKKINYNDVILRSRKSINFGESEITKIINNVNLKEKFTKVLRLFDFCGHVMFQAKLNGEALKILECNPRLGGASTSSNLWGLDSVGKFIEMNYNLKKKSFKKKYPGTFIVYKKSKFV